MANDEVAPVTDSSSPLPHIPHHPKPFGLDDVHAIFLVQGGHVDLYLARAGHAADDDTRIHITRLEAGALVLGFDPQTVPAGWEVTLLPARGARLEMVFEDDIQNMPAQIEAWIQRLTEACMPSHEPVSPRSLAVGQTLTVVDKQCAVRGAEPVIWLQDLSGQGVQFGDLEARVAHGMVFPMGQAAWVQAHRGQRLSARATAEVLADGSWWPALIAFQGLLAQALLHRSQANAATAQVRLAERVQADARVFDATLRHMMAPMADAGPQLARGTAAQPLLRACQALGQVQGINFQWPGASEADFSTQADPVLALCRAARVKYRQVALDAGWHRREGLPLLAYRAADGAPVALLPRRGQGYQLYDPQDDTTVPVSDELAASLRPLGVMFYRAFAPQPIRLRQLAAFGLLGSWRDLGLALGLALLVSGLGLLTPMITAIVFDEVIPGADRSRMAETMAFLLAATVASLFLGLCRDHVFLRIETRAETSVQAAVFDRLLSLPAHFFRRYTAGELAQRAYAIGQIRSLLTQSALGALFSGLFALLNLAYLLWLHPLLALLAVGLTTLTLVVLGVVSVFYLRVHAAMVDKGAQNAGLTLQLVAAMSKLRVAGAERRAYAQWMRLSNELNQLGLQAERIGQRFAVFNTVYSPLSLAVVYGLIGLLLARPQGPGLSTGELLAFSSAYGAFSGGVIQVAQVALGLLAAVPLYRSVQPILDAEPEADVSKPAAPPLKGQIELSQVSMRYRPDAPWVLNKVSLVVEPGQFVAIVGPSGAGKSSIFRLLLGFERPESGSVSFDGHDLAHYDVASVRQQMGVVLQSAKLFRGELFENIACGVPCTLDEAWEAARLAGLADDIQAMPMGMKTLVGDDGAGLSGGQRQRLMIARAVVGKPRILLFDEATSALDNRTQALVSQSLEGLNATRVVIAHRLSTIVRADRIFVVDAGRIVQSGTYEELLAQPGLFGDLARRQLA